MDDFGTLKRVSPRKKWAKEAHDFTPWLASNIHRLNDVIGLELEIENTEVAVGPYSADILAINTGTGRYVVIENQLEKTNHDHLGKAITYASVLDASTIIWIASDFTEEHRRALDWLNDNSNNDIMFYGIQIELLQIDDSNLAVQFNVLSKPILAVRQAAKNKGNNEFSELRLLQLEFWQRFREKLEKTKKVPTLQTPAAQLWYNVALGKSDIFLSNRCNFSENTVSVCVYIGNKIVDSMLPFLESRKSEIELAIGEPLQWNPNPNSRDKIIVLHYATDFSVPEKVESALNWLVDNTIKFRNVFANLIKEAPK